MSSIRGRAIKVGGMSVDPQGASARTEGPPNAVITRPAFRSAQGVSQPAGVGGGGRAALLDLSAIPAWRLIAVAAAALWLGVVWISLRGGISGGVRV